MNEAKNEAADQAPDQPSNSTRWLSPALLTAVAALLAAAMPFTAYINGRYSIELEREKFIADLNLKYVDRAIDKERDPADRDRLLHFLVETTDESAPLHRWASNELKNADEIRKLRAELAESDMNRKRVSAELARLEKGRSTDRARERSLRGELEKAAKERVRLAESLQKASDRAGADRSCPSVSELRCVGALSVPLGGNSLPGCESEIVAYAAPWSENPGRVYWLKIDAAGKRSECKNLTTGDTCTFSLRGKEWVATLGRVSAAAADVRFQRVCPN